MNTIIHAAFRRDLERFDAALAAPGSAAPARARQLEAAWDNYQFQLHHHHTDEETIFWPAFRDLGADAAVMAELESEHEVMLAALDAAATAMTSYASTPSTDSAAVARTAVTGLCTALENHLAHEERDLEPFVVDHLDTPQFKATQKAVRRAYKGDVGTFVSWLDDGADPATRAGLRHEIPPPVLAIMKTVGGRDYRRRIAPVWQSA